LFIAVPQEKPSADTDIGCLLQQARVNNRQCGISGLLLYTEGSFFQVLEGPAETVDRLFNAISNDRRHMNITVIMREPISKRDFKDWSMGFSDISRHELDQVAGINDFFLRGESFARLEPGRVKKLLEAFRHGRWRGSISDSTPVPEKKIASPAPWPEFSFAFQPIIHAPTSSIFSYEALIRGPANESADRILTQVPESEMHRFDEYCRVAALELAARIGFPARLNLNFMASSLEITPTAISSLLTTALRCRIRPEQIVLEILESDILHDMAGIAAALRQHQGAGLVFAIDDFGAGYAGLNLLAEFQPTYVKLDMQLVRGTESDGPRQAIVRGIAQTCGDLGIDIIAEGVETEAEYTWFRQEGIELFQGYLFSPPLFEQLPASCRMPGE